MTMTEEQKFRGSWTPVIGEPAKEKGETVVLKLQYGSEVRLVELTEPLDMAKLSNKFASLFGTPAVALTYSIPGDLDEIIIKTDDEVRLAQRFGGTPLKIVGVLPDREEENTDHGEWNVFEWAAHSLAQQDVDAPAKQIELLLEILKLRPRRLVKYGLAPRQALKNKAWDDDDDEDDFQKVDDDDDDTDDKDTVIVEDAEVVGEAEDDVIVKALRTRGVTLAPATIHALVRMLEVIPRRFVKLRLVSDLHAAREAYKVGGRDAADKLFHGNRRGWGRGLCGGRGRGRGSKWLFDQDLPDKKKHRHHHHHHRGDHHIVQDPRGHIHVNRGHLHIAHHHFHGGHHHGHHRGHHGPPHGDAEFGPGPHGFGPHGPPPHPRFAGSGGGPF